MRARDFQTLVDQFYEPLFRFAWSLSGNHSDASDLVQQTYFIWARQGASLRDENKAKGWLFTTLYREFLRTHRRSARFVVVEDTERISDLEPETDDWVDRIDGPAVIEALGAIDEVFRVPVTLFYLEHLSYKEIASVLSVPMGTVMSRLARGKRQLRAHLERSTQQAGKTGATVIPIDFRKRASGNG